MTTDEPDRSLDEVDVPSHVDASVATLAALHADHHRRTSPVKRIVARLVAFLGQPAFVGGLSVLVVGWIAANLMLGPRAWDPPPFTILIDAATILAVYITLLILITQRHENELSQTREQLTLELGVLSEQKSAKIIELLEELRRDSPHIADRHDAEAAELSKSSDPGTVLGAIRKHDELSL